MHEKFKAECDAEIEKQNDPDLRKKFQDLFFDSRMAKYSYHFSWLGRPIIQFPQDIVAMQEIIWEVKPDLIIETGIARGGSIIFYASMMELLGGNGHVLGIDIDIRQHNRIEIEKHPMFKRITMFEGSSIDSEMEKHVREFAKSFNTIMVCLDSNHTHAHVLEELKIYTPLVTKGSYCVVFDTVIEDCPEGSFPNRPWNKGNNPKTAVLEFLKTHPEFEINKFIENKLLVTAARWLVKKNLTIYSKKNFLNLPD